jgi:MFS family permease
MTTPDLGGRKQKLRLGWGVGNVLGLVIGLVIGLVLAAWTRPGHPIDGMLGASLGLGGFFGGFAGLGLAHLLTAVPAGRRRMGRDAAYGALVGGTFGCVVAALCCLDFWYRVIPLHEKVMQLIAFPAVFTPVGMFLGLLAGSAAVDERATKERDALLRQLDAERAAVEAAIAKRFGPLDEVRRARIQAWDADRLTEARRKLEEARSVEELDA